MSEEKTQIDNQLNAIIKKIDEVDKEIEKLEEELKTLNIDELKPQLDAVGKLSDDLYDILRMLKYETGRIYVEKTTYSNESAYCVKLPLRIFDIYVYARSTSEMQSAINELKKEIYNEITEIIKQTISIVHDAVSALKYKLEKITAIEARIAGLRDQIDKLKEEVINIEEKLEDC